MKKLIFLAITFLGFNTIKAQTYISPIVGYDITSLTTNNNSVVAIQIYENKLNVHNGIVGLKIKQRLYKNFDLVVSSSFSKRYTDASIIGIVPYDGFIFKNFQNSLCVSYKFSGFFCTLGGNYNLINDITLTIDKKEKGKAYIEKFDEKGIRFSFGKTYKNFNLEAYFYKGLITPNLKQTIHLNPLESLGVLLSYDIKVFNGFKKKNKAACPTF